MQYCIALERIIGLEEALQTTTHSDVGNIILVFPIIMLVLLTHFLMFHPHTAVAVYGTVAF